MADQEGACKSGEFIVVSLTPDVCWTPVGSTLVPGALHDPGRPERQPCHQSRHPVRWTAGLLPRPK